MSFLNNQEKSSLIELHIFMILNLKLCFKATIFAPRVYVTVQW